MIKNAPETDADALILDLEDAVPDTEKEPARSLLRGYIEEDHFAEIPTYCRLNGDTTEYFLQDVRSVASSQIDGFVYPMVTSEDDVRFFAKYLQLVEKETGVSKFDIIPLIETPSSILNVQSICTVSERVVAVAFGAEDYFAELESTKERLHETLHVPRALIAMAARSTGVVPIDTVYIDIDDLDGFRSSLERAHALGFEGALVLHP
jgi:citrate lyase subunit beta/citryl-CoA lyase